MEKYLVVIEKGENNYAAFSPDVWGCIATGKTIEETLSRVKEGIKIQLEGFVDLGEDIPKAKGIGHHISDGVLKEGKIADEYFITEVGITVH
jgi:predicted RNase H-like HicB family nuclease